MHAQIRGPNFKKLQERLLERVATLNKKPDQGKPPDRGGNPDPDDDGNDGGNTPPKQQPAFRIPRRRDGFVNSWR